MAGTRRGNDRKQQSDAFEAANPFLTRVETEIEVVRGEPPFLDHGGGNKNQINLLDIPLEGEDLDPLIPQVTQDGEIQPILTFDGDFGISETILFGGFFSPSVSVLSADPEAGDGPEVPFNFGDPSVLVLTELGFGVSSEQEFFGGEGPIPVAQFVDHEGGVPEGPPELYALDDEELMIFFVGGGPVVIAPDPRDRDLDLQNGEHGDGPEFPLGAVSVDIDYLVVGGSGELLAEFGRFEGEDSDGEASSGQLSNGDAGQLSFNATGEGPLELFALGVSGSLEVVVTGVSLTTNFAGLPFDPIMDIA